MKYTQRFLAIIAIALAGCSEAAVQPHSSCELMTEQICSNAAESQIEKGTFSVSYTFRPEEARVVPFVVPVMRPDGALAAEVDCYANTDSHSYSIVRSDIAIKPGSEASVDFLRDRHLCANQGYYTQDQRPRVQTATTEPLLSR